MQSLMRSARPLRIYKLFNFWVVENHWTDQVFYCDDFTLARVELDVQILERWYALNDLQILERWIALSEVTP